MMEEAITTAYCGFAEVYDLLMADVDYDCWCAYIIKLLDMSCGNIVDCACGTGEISIRLAKAGFYVTGVDLSESMLRVAAEKARRAGKSIPFVCQDMADLTLHRPVDAIVCTCDGVNYLDDPKRLTAFFAAAYRSLLPGGKLLFDISSAYKLEHVIGDHTFTSDERDCAYLWTNSYDAAKKLSHMNLSLFIRHGQLYHRVDEYHVQRAYTQAEIERALLDAGFEPSGTYDCFTLDKPKPDSERLQFVAVKPKG